MPFQMGWHKENCIVKVLVCGDITLNDANNLNRALVEYLDCVQQPVHVLFDATQVNSFPTSHLQIKNTLTCMDHAQLGWIAFIDDGAAANPLLPIVSQLLGDKFRAFPHLKAGLEFLKSQDSMWMGAVMVNRQFANAQPSGSFPQRA